MEEKKKKTQLRSLFFMVHHLYDQYYEHIEKNVTQHSEIIIRGQCNIMFIIWTGKYGKTKCNSPHLAQLIPASHFWSGFVWGR